MRCQIFVPSPKRPRLFDFHKGVFSCNSKIWSPWSRRSTRVLKKGIYGRQCPECGAVSFRPTLQCLRLSQDRWVQVSGHGHLIDFTLPGPQNDKPYTSSRQVRLRRRRDSQRGSQYTYLVIYGITKKKAPEIRPTHGGRDRRRPC